MAVRISPGALIVFVTLLFLFVNPSSNPSIEAEDSLMKDTIDYEKLELGVTINATLADFEPNVPDVETSLDLPGFRPSDGFYWPLLPSVQKLARSQLIAASNSLINESALQDSASLTALVYKNISGWADGRWVRSALAGQDTSVPVNRSAIDSRAAQFGEPFTHNVTGLEGKMHVYLAEESDDRLYSIPPPFGNVNARINVQHDSAGTSESEFFLKGVHDRQSGGLILTTTSTYFAGIFALAHLSLLNSTYDRLKPHLVKSLNDTISRQESHLDKFEKNPWGKAGELVEEYDSPPQCELIVYLQQFELDATELGVEPNAAIDDMDEIALAVPMLEMVEKNLRRPSGLVLPSTPNLKLSATLFSPDCGFVLQSKGPPDFWPDAGDHLRGIKLEVREHRARQALIAFVLIMIGQVLLLMRQINEAATPSKKNRISFTTITMLSMGSGLLSFAFLLLSSVVVRLVVLSMAIAFLAFMDGLFFSMKFILEIWTTQEPERLQQRRTGPPSQPTARAASVTDTSDSSLPTTSSQLRASGASDGATPIGIPNVRAPLAATAAQASASQPTFGSVYARYCLILLFIAFLSIWIASSWSETVQAVYANSLAVLYLSFWVPQIYRNVVRNCRKALLHTFVIGQSVLRFLPIAYVYGVESNALMAETDLRMLAVLACWLWIQIVVLLAQEIIGPRFFVSEKWSWVPAAYEYHPILREDEEGAPLPVGLNPSEPIEEKTFEKSIGSSLESNSSDKKSSKERYFKNFDCSICMNKIEVPIVPSGQTVASGEGGTAADVFSGAYRARRLYSVTPCRHIYHTTCLENWMGYRLQCPICRESLPPL